MKILAVSWIKGVPVPPKGYGGIERTVATLCAEWKRQGHSVVLIAPQGSCVDGVGIIETSDFMEAYEDIQDMPFDVVFDNSCWSPESPVRRPLNKPFLSVTHVNHAVGHTRNVVYLSTAQRNAHAEQTKRDLSQSPVVRVPTDPTLKPIGLERKDYLLFLGMVAEHKGVHRAAEIAQMLDRELIVAGPAYGEYSDKVAAMPNVQMIGEVQDPQRSALLEQAFAVMCLHGNEGGWIEPGCGVVGEAGAFNTPVAALPNGCLGEIVYNDCNGWIDEGTGSVALRMRDNPTLPHADQLALNDWSAETIAKQYVGLFERVINGETWG